jgi:thioester reductase-like protein
MNTDERIAVVGMHVKLPNGIDTTQKMWQLLMEGGDVFTRGPVAGSRVPITSHIEDAHWFAAERFGISAFEAELMDPQHRLLLEMSWECLGTAGSGTDTVTGVFTSCSPSALLEDVLLNRPDTWARNYSRIIEGTHGDYLATRIAYRLGLTGPALHIGTGCSSALVALNQAVQSLNAFQCDRALVASASIHAPTETGYEVREGGIYSADGYCRPFSQDANGTVPGNGASVVLLKRLEDALADGDHIHAVVLGSAVNNDGNRKVGFTAPSVEGQVDCIATALDVAEAEPSQVRYVEAHGTGTRVGDPIELRALAKAYGPAGPGGRYLGSVKANIGHCDVAAGLLGLVKTAMILEHGIVPPQLYADTPTTSHDWSDDALRIAGRPVELGAGPGRDTPLVAGVSSLGVGGTNAHVLLQDAVGVIGADEVRRREPRPLVRITGRKPYGPAVPADTEEAATVPASRPAAASVTVADEDLLELLSRHTAEPVGSLDDDFFAHGGDSLGVIYLLDEVQELCGVQVSIEEFTGNPTAACLREHLQSTAGGPDHAAPAEAEAAADPDATVAAEVAARLAHVVPAADHAGPAGQVLLTGASGFVGTYILADLLARGLRVVCLLRGGEERRGELTARLREFGLWSDGYEDRLELVAGDIAQPGLGLDQAAFDDLASRTEWVVHSAAVVNHLYPYARLAQANAHSAVGVIEFAAAIRRKSVTFLSTSAVFESAAYPPGAEIESGPLSALPPESNGYGRSKAFAEAYFERAGELGLSVTVLRIPNVFGDRTTHRINRGDAIWSWTSAILATGRYPASFDSAADELFQALPGDAVARLVAEEARPSGRPGCRIVNAIPNLACSSRGMIAGLRAAGRHPRPLADREWYAQVGRLDVRDVWVAALAGQLAERQNLGEPQRLHRFPLHDDPAVAELVNAQAVWSPKDLAGYLGVLSDGTDAAGGSATDPRPAEG